MIENRKDDHIRIASEQNVEEGNNLFNEVYLIHIALPEIDFDDVDTSMTIFGKKLSFPFIIGAMTGGTEIAEKINAILAKCAEEFGIGMYVGSQRVAIVKPETARSFRVVAENAPTALKIANLGAPQVSRLNERVLSDWVSQAIDMINADAIAIHLNPAQEVFQPEGEPWFRGVTDRLRFIKKIANRPLIIKEVGNGISMEVARTLVSRVGPDAIDVAGTGGTSFIRIESIRARAINEANIFSGWGIPTVLSICEVRNVYDGFIIASGGVRSGLDGAKAIAIGANAFSMSRPLLLSALKGYDETKKFIDNLFREFKATMFLTGSKNISELSRAPVVLGQDIISWLGQRGITCRRVGA
ncbi:type 2 isopentenyl-diphosphate Delta-isomerase [Vulcanisaeta souniana]|uniref:Isopentenyl-diphosphate delta-isomerase n=1 Tax=Vulcanisaeta souniana JCM 11219 TaxID=1293586 RepID=A0A830E8E8_9CREN|nr:type 2 isopentenyl-diphosphate Delta-isomerase [Vulcanisaeta souniana]BDR91543.1 type 2 isopentenyl-diphosphate Delta-isomerase [Vulcanisaeta souniana JCM 11219]GGI74018.1 type 2 isopentenyl-diphosphate Delta-isomerase [Vulcanisaeta souniana JCM 11219]